MGKGDERSSKTRPSVVGGSAMSAQVAQLTGAFLDSVPDNTPAEELVSMRRLIDRLEAVWLTQAAAFETTGGPSEAGLVSLGPWFRARCRLAPGEAASRAKVAVAITTGSMARTGESMRAGLVSWRHAAVIEATMRDCPADRRDDAEAALQEPAKQLDPTLLRRVGAELLHRLDVDRAEQAAVRRLERRGLSVGETFDGMVAVNGLLDPVSGAMLMAALDANVSPTRENDTDLRSWPQRRADALADICHEWLDMQAGDSRRSPGRKPHLSVLVDVRTLRNETGAGTADLDWTGPITAEESRMIACDSSVSRVLTDGPSQVLDIGRSTRTIPPGIRRGVVVRDRTCIADGCYRGPQHCDVHHIVFWEDGGPTSLSNLALLCRRHHRLVHQRGWRVLDGQDGTKSLVRPSGLSPPG